MTRSRLLPKLRALPPGLIALGGFAVLALIFTWSLALHLSSHVIGPWLGDNFEYVWKMWWVPHALRTPGLSPLFNPDMAYPDGYALANGELTPVHTYFLLPLTWLFGEVVAYNLAVLLSFVLSGWFVYCLAARWIERLGLPEETPGGLRFGGAFFAGAAFAFSAYRLVRAGGHLPLIDTQWLVLALWMLDRWFETHRPVHAALVGVGFGLAALSSWYYAFMLLLLLPVYAVARPPLSFGHLPLARGRQTERSEVRGGQNLEQQTEAVTDDWRGLLRDARTWIGGGLALVTALVLSIPFLIPYLQLWSAGETAVPLNDASFWAYSPLDYLLPNPRHPLWGGLIQRIAWPVPGSEMPAEFAAGAVGWITLLLAVWGWQRLRGPSWRALKWTIGAAFVLSLGPILHLGRLPLGIPLPVMLLRGLPFAGSIRSWGRFSVMVMLGMSLLAGAGLVLLLKDLPRRRAQGFAAGLIVALLAGSWIGPAALVAVAPRPVDAWLADQPGDSPIMQYPISEALSGPSVLYTRYHGKPVVFGYGTYFPLRFRERNPELYDFPADAALDKLAGWDVQYILVDAASLSAEPYTLVDLDANPRLRHVATLGDQAVYQLLTEDSP